MLVEHVKEKDKRNSIRSPGQIGIHTSALKKLKDIALWLIAKSLFNKPSIRELQNGHYDTAHKKLTREMQKRNYITVSLTSALRKLLEAITISKTDGRMDKLFRLGKNQHGYCVTSLDTWIHWHSLKDLAIAHQKGPADSVYLDFQTISLCIIHTYLTVVVPLSQNV